MVYRVHRFYTSTIIYRQEKNISCTSKIQNPASLYENRLHDYLCIFVFIRVFIQISAFVWARGRLSSASLYSQTLSGSRADFIRKLFVCLFAVSVLFYSVIITYLKWSCLRDCWVLRCKTNALLYKSLSRYRAKTSRIIIHTASFIMILISNMILTVLQVEWSGTYLLFKRIHGGQR